MKKAYSIHSEFGGYEFLLVRKPSMLGGILSKTGLASAKRSRKSVATALDTRDDFTNISPEAFLRDGWHTLRAEPDTSTATGLAGLVKDRIALFLNSTGYIEECPTWRDKCHALYVRDEIDVGIEILPMKSLQAEMSSGPGYYEGELYNVIRNGRGVPAVPLVMIGVAP